MDHATEGTPSSTPYAPPLRFAWWGRVSTEDQQDPTLSLPRQLHNSRAVLPPGSVIVAHFYDIESGRRELELRGRSTAHERFDIPIARDGGIQDLLEEAQRPDRTFDAVICESIERIARRTYFGTKIEHDLESSGVALFAADEPIVLNGKRATTILTRRVKQGVAEWYVLELLEKSWDGFCEHTRQGWKWAGRPTVTQPRRSLTRSQRGVPRAGPRAVSCPIQRGHEWSIRSSRGAPLTVSAMQK
jgi:DNA invertase Pin-like site-specific DNA recombinase